jgi:hypothetical protein
MATAATAAAGTKTRKTPNRANGRGLTNYFSSSNEDNSLNQLRVQRLIGNFGLSPAYAAVVAPLVFGGQA